MSQKTIFCSDPLKKHKKRIFKGVKKVNKEIVLKSHGLLQEDSLLCINCHTLISKEPGILKKAAVESDLLMESNEEDPRDSSSSSLPQKVSPSKDPDRFPKKDIHRENILPSSDESPIKTNEPQISVAQSRQKRVVQDACENLWADILKAYKAGSQKTSLPEESVPNVTEKYLQAAVYVDEQIPEGLPLDADFQQKYVVQQLKNNIKDQENLLYLMDLMEATLTNQLLEEQEDDEKLKTITKALTRASSKRAEAGGINENRYRQETKKQIEKMKAERLWLSKSLVDFVRKYFPKQRQSTLFSTANTREPYSLMKIIMALIDRTLNHSHDTYITVNSHFSPDYLELLKECRIIETHPKNDSKVRLIPHILP